MPPARKKIAGFIAGLCLLCCAAPLAAVLAGGAGLAATSPWLLAFSTELACVAAIIGVVAVVYAAYRIWRRSTQDARCEVK